MRSITAFPNIVGLQPEFIREHLPSNQYVSLLPLLYRYYIVINIDLWIESYQQRHARSDVLPTKFDIIIDTSVDRTSMTHFLAIYSSAAPPTPRWKVVLYPAHN